MNIYIVITIEHYDMQAKQKENYYLILTVKTGK